MQSGKRKKPLDFEAFNTAFTTVCRKIRVV
nr:MAG TPA: hypothetical protein [Caudoviricetes sp.]